ncbi:hypothetical protein ACCS79_03670 [Rhizobium johnstonii]|uniref:hypothetical protein n=1 Tax=Rhizobium johnstonii TaxID=3019933 RepID=UPI003F9B6644
MSTDEDDHEAEFRTYRLPSGKTRSFAPDSGTATGPDWELSSIGPEAEREFRKEQLERWNEDGVLQSVKESLSRPLVDQKKFAEAANFPKLASVLLSLISGMYRHGTELTELHELFPDRTPERAAITAGYNRHMKIVRLVTESILYEIRSISPLEGDVMPADEDWETIRNRIEEYMGDPA